ncbi:hypothetical protein [Nonomuraea typhae]|uniref:hypothetical protein n=1 Tax=Nonomuraea typhae TaxID=2603600 RepID=UPI0012F988B7|nr:hypothetical protein [Nonomuraea typhae]
MSAGAMAVVAVPAVLPVAVGVLAIGGAALLIARAASRGAELAAEGAAVLGDTMEAELARLADERRAADQWRDAAALVVKHNARIAALRAAAGKMSIALALPEPLTVAGADLATIGAWCADTTARLDQALAVLSSHTAGAACRRLAGKLGGTSAPLVTVAQALARARLTTPRSAPAAPGGVADKLDTQLAKLSHEVSAEDYARILETAAGIRMATSVQAERAGLDQLVRQVHDANAAARRRREDAVCAGAYLQSFHATGLPDAGDGGAARVLERLNAVVAGDAPLDDDLRGRAEELNREALCRAQQMYLRETVAALMRDMGWDVAGDAQVLTLTRDDWSGHHATVDVGDRMVRGHVVRTAPPAGADGRRQDRERCADFARYFDGMAARLPAEHSRPEISVDAAVEVAAPAAGATRRHEGPIYRERS